MVSSISSQKRTKTSQLRFHSSKVEFVRSFFVETCTWKNNFDSFLTFSTSQFNYGATIFWIFLKKLLPGNFWHFLPVWHFLALFIIFCCFRFSTSLLAVQYFLPMAIISVLYSRIAFRSWGNTFLGFPKKVHLDNFWHFL